MSHRALAFRCIAACLSVAMLAVAGLLVCWGAAGQLPWLRVLPAVVGQCIFGVTFGLFAAGRPGPFNRSPRR